MINKVKIILSDFKKYRDIRFFLKPHYQKINVARLQHLESLGLDLNKKSVIEFGAGIGDHTLFYLFKNCNILPTEGRKNLAEYIAERFGIETMMIDIEKDIEVIKSLPYFDIIHCYGILYHINNAGEFIDLMKNIGGVLILETCVSPDSYEQGDHIVSKIKENPTQAISGNGCRPSRKWIFERLKNNFKYVYMPVTQPKHEQFPVDWDNIVVKGKQLVRSVFIASHKPIRSNLLKSEIVKKYQQW